MLTSPSWTHELRLSMLFCKALNLGNAFFIIIIIEITSTGTTIINTIASDGLITNAIVIAPISIPGDRRHARSVCIIIFWICVISLVSLVISDPVENLSILLNENFCIFSNKSIRRSAPKFMAALAANHAPSTPPTAIHTATKTMTSPILVIYPTSWLAAPTLIIFDNSHGRIISPATSTSIKISPKI